MRTNRKTTVTYGGRTFCHQQFHALLLALMNDGWKITFRRRLGSTQCRLEGWRRAIVDAPSLWLALAGAVNKLED